MPFEPFCPVDTVLFWQTTPNHWWRKNLNGPRDPKHAQFKGCLSSLFWDLTQPTCMQHLTTLSLAVAVPGICNYVPVLHCFWDIARCWSKIANLNVPHLYLAPPYGVTSLEFRQDIWRKNTKRPWAIVWRCLLDPMFSRFGTVPACVRQTDGQTDRHSTAAYSALA